MENQRNALKAGVFMIISFVLVVAIIVGIRGIGELVEPTQTREIRFDLVKDIGGLSIGDDVRVGGYKVGIVRGIKVVPRAEDPEGEPVIVVQISMPQRLAVREHAIVRVQETLTGLSWINFQSLGTGAELAADVPLEGQPSPINQLIANMGEIAPGLVEMVADLRGNTLPQVNQAIEKANETIAGFEQVAGEATQLLQQVRGQVDPTAERYQTLAERGSEALSEIRDLVGDSKGDLRETASNLSETTGVVRDRLPDLFEQVESVMENLDTTLTGVVAALEDVQATAANARELTGAASSIVLRNRGRIDGIITSVRSTSENLRGATAEIRRAPWRLMYRPRPGELGNLTLFESAREFAEGASHLNDAARALRDAVEDPTLEERELEALLERLQRSFQEFRQVEQHLWDEVRP